MSESRGASPVVGTVVLVAVVVIVGVSLTVPFLGIVQDGIDTNEKPVPVTDNLLSDPGFEDEDGSWDHWGPGSVVAEQPNYGAAALKVPAGSNDAYHAQNVTKKMRAGSTYRLCAWSKRTDPDGETWVGVQFYETEDKNEIIEKQTWRVEWNSYREECVLAETPNETSVHTAEVWVYRPADTEGVAYVDDVSLVRMAYLADPDER